MLRACGFIPRSTAFCMAVMLELRDIFSFLFVQHIREPFYKYL